MPRAPGHSLWETVTPVIAVAWHFADGRPIERYSDTIPLPGMTGDVEGLAMYAGQSVGLIEDVLPAGEIVQQLVTETQVTLERVNRLVIAAAK